MPASTNTMALAKHYDQLEPEERLAAVLSAMARRDEPEATRLADSCPRGSYTCGDPAFFDGLHLALDAAALAEPCGPAEGPFESYSMAALVLHISREAIHHGAEIALLRDLYVHRDALVGRRS